MKLYDYLYSEVFNKLQEVAKKQNKKKLDSKTDSESFETDQWVSTIKSKDLKLQHSNYRLIFNQDKQIENIKTTEISFSVNGRYGAITNLGVVKIFSSLLPEMINYIKSHNEKYYSFSGYKTNEEEEKNIEIGKREKVYVNILKSLKKIPQFKNTKIYRTKNQIKYGSFENHYYVFCPKGDSIKSSKFKEI